MFPAQSRTVIEQLRTELEELNNAILRIEDVLRDKQLTEAERIERALAITEVVRAAAEQHG